MEQSNSLLTNIRSGLGIETAPAKVVLPENATPIVDENSKTYAYAIGDNVHDLNHNLIGTTSDVMKSVEANPSVSLDAAAVAEPSKLAVAPAKAELVKTVNTDDVVAAMLARAMDIAERTVVVIDNKKVNIPLTLDFGVFNKGIFSSQNYSADTLPKFRMDLNWLKQQLINGDWPEYQTSQPIEFQFNDAGALTVPASGFTRGVIAPIHFNAGGTTTNLPLAYKLVVSVVDTLIGSSQIEVFGTANKYNRIYRFNKTTIGLIVFPRVAGNVNDYSIGAAAPVVFDGVDGSEWNITATANVSPSVPDEFDPLAGQVVFGGKNVNVQITPYIPDRREAINLSQLISMGADAELMAKTIAALANLKA